MSSERPAPKKVWVRGVWRGIGCYVVCPFCPDKREQALNETMPWCSTCGCEYRITTRGATFDQSLKTPRYAWGKAFNLAGGMRIGNVSTPAPESTARRRRKS